MSLYVITGSIFFLLFLFLLRSEYEKKHFIAETFTIETRKPLTKDRTLVFLSDLHNNEFGLHNDSLLEAIYQISPDAVLIGGDMMVARGKAELEVPLHLIKELTSHYPVYYGNGNHEIRMDREREHYGNQYDIYIEAIRSMGVHYLSNSTARIGTDLVISGVNLEDKYYTKFRSSKISSEDLNRWIGKSDSSRFQILLGHSPLLFEAYAKWGADLSLSGHFHGGTIRIPVLGGVMTPQFQFFHPLCGGMFVKDGRHLIVSRGLGTHSINIRLNNRPQLVVIHLKQEK